jgi:hypothetical protein
MRLKVPSRRHDTAFFERLEQQLAAIPEIEATLMTPATASVLLRFAEGEGDGVAAAVDALEGIALAKPDANRAASPNETAANEAAEPSLQQGNASGRVDRRALAFTVLVLLLLRQLLRGGWLAPGLALVWFLFEVLRARMPEDEAR